MSEKELQAQHTVLLTELTAVKKTIATASGAFKATGVVGGILGAAIIVLFIWIQQGALGELRSQGKQLTQIKQEVAVIKSEFKSKIVLDNEWKRSVDDRLEKVLYRD